MRNGTLGMALAGGASRRFGASKAAATMADGRTMLARCVDTLSALGADVAVLTRDEDTARAAVGTRPVIFLLDRDVDVAQGPLSALAAALDWAAANGYVRVVVLGVDLPGVQSADLLVLRAAMDGATTAVVALDGERIQPLVAIYAPNQVAAPLLAAVAHGERRLVVAVQALDPFRVRLPARAFVNINTTEDLALFEADVG